MIAYLKGKVLSANDSSVIIENNGVGFEVLCSSSAYVDLATKGEGEVWVYTSVREDGISLFGFSTLAEKSMFLKLISVSGIGPKMGITILSGMSLNDLAFAIASSDIKTLSKIKGLGKKTAERIVVELRESMANEGEIITKKTPTVSQKISKDGENAILALQSLGYSRQVATSCVQEVVDLGVTGLENIIKESLKRFA